MFREDHGKHNIRTFDGLPIPEFQQDSDVNTPE
jgi:hypothetical protein